jgi:hypothetical protein
MYATIGNLSSNFLSTKSVTESLGNDEQHKGHESEVTVNGASKENMTLVRSRTNVSGRGRDTCTLERTPTPRIRRGSKPPLSRSAFVDGGVPCLDEQCGGACRRCKAKEGYFPHEKRARRVRRQRN